MKKLLLLISFIVSGLISFSQNLGTPYSTIHVLGNLHPDSALLNPLYDTSFAKRSMGNQILNLFDTSLYYYNGRIWVAFGGSGFSTIINYNSTTNNRLNLPRKDTGAVINPTLGRTVVIEPNDNNFYLYLPDGTWKLMSGKYGYPGEDVKAYTDRFFDNNNHVDAHVNASIYEWTTLSGSQLFIAPGVGTALLKALNGIFLNGPINAPLLPTNNSPVYNVVSDINHNLGYTAYSGGGGSGLTSVGLSMPTGFTVSNSPLTSNGTISVTGAGTTSQYFDGTGALQTFPAQYWSLGTYSLTQTNTLFPTIARNFAIQGNSYLNGFVSIGGPDPSTTTGTLFVGQSSKTNTLVVGTGQWTSNGNALILASAQNNAVTSGLNRGIVSSMSYSQSSSFGATNTIGVQANLTLNDLNSVTTGTGFEANLAETGVGTVTHIGAYKAYSVPVPSMSNGNIDTLYGFIANAVPDALINQVNHAFYQKGNGSKTDITFETQKFYLPNIPAGTIASGGNLGLDANGMMVKATVSGGGGGSILEIPGTAFSGQTYTNTNLNGLTYTIFLNNINRFIYNDNSGTHEWDYVAGGGFILNTFVPRSTDTFFVYVGNYVPQPIYSSVLLTNSQFGTTYTLVLTDQGYTVDMNNAGANVVTVPNSSTVSFPIGTIIQISQQGAGQTSVTGAAGVTIHSPQGALKIDYQYDYGTLKYKGSNVWDFFGGITN